MICFSFDMEILAFGTGVAPGQKAPSVRRHRQLISSRHPRRRDREHRSTPS
jgi:hypothetical protein